MVARVCKELFRGHYSVLIKKGCFPPFFVALNPLLLSLSSKRDK